MKTTYMNLVKNEQYIFDSILDIISEYRYDYSEVLTFDSEKFEAMIETDNEKLKVSDKIVIAVKDYINDYIAGTASFGCKHLTDNI